jgi:hypothetical protein
MLLPTSSTFAYLLPVRRAFTLVSGVGGRHDGYDGGIEARSDVLSAVGQPSYR